MANSTTIYRGKDGRQWIDVDQASKVLTAADEGLVQNVTVDGITITLPATAAGASYTIRNGGAAPSGGPAGATSDQSVAVTVAPNSADGFTGNGFTAATNKAAINTKATAQVGDEIRVLGSGTTGVTGWNFSEVKGTWARQA